MPRFLAYLAIAFGSFLAIGEAVRNWGDWQWWPFWLVDYISATLLVAGGLMTARSPSPRSHTILGTGWGFACAMFWMSFWGHVGDSSASGQATDPLTLIIGALFAITVVGLVGSLSALGRD